LNGANFKEHFLSTSATQTTHPAPEPVARLRDVMSGYPRDWSLCGGWAVDAWLGRLTREHGDVDLSVFVEDQEALFEHLRDWQLLAHDPVFDETAPGHNAEWWDGLRRLEHPSHIHARPPESSGPMPEGGIAREEDGFWLDIQIDDRSGNDWIIKREPRVCMPMPGGVRQSIWGVPVPVPEVLLFLKAAQPRRRDERDFLALLPQLNDEQRDWLSDALAKAFPDHHWIPALEVLHPVRRSR
jgi:Aminoglycoside-2''-adenylyltransferase